MKYILTGFKGLIGTFLKQELDKKHECVYAIDRKSGFDINELAHNDGVRYAQADMMVHLAAHCKINEGVREPYLPHTNNTDGIFNVLEFCRKNNIPKIVVASSSRVLAKERNPYVASKVYSEELTKAYHDCYGLEYLIIRPSTVYGPVKDVTSRLMHDWCQKALRNEELPIYGKDDKTLDFTYVTDFTDGIALLIDNWDKTKNQDYNISGNEEANLTQLGKMIIKEANGGWIKYYPPEVAQPQQVNIDTSKIRALGYEPKVGVEEGIKRMVEFYRNG